MGAMIPLAASLGGNPARQGRCACHGMMLTWLPWTAGRDPGGIGPSRVRASTNGRTGMKYVLPISAALLLALSQLQPASAQTTQLGNEAVKAQGGADALRAPKGVSISGDANYWARGQWRAGGSEPKQVAEARFTISRELAIGLPRRQWRRQ